MKIVEPSFKILTPTDGIACLKFIEGMARISHKSEDKQTEDTWERFIKSVVVDRGDWSVVEHQSATVLMTVDRGVSHEIVRHRLFSYTQSSTRFINYKKVGEIEVIRPEGLTPEFESPWEESIAKSCWAYTVLMERGAQPQMARSVLPNALASTISVTGNLRNWRHIFLMRTTRESHPDLKRVMIPLLEEFKKLIPLLYQDIEPNMRQIDNLKKAR